jgi:hypothetical protein
LATKATGVKLPSTLYGITFETMGEVVKTEALKRSV